jgi:hypothetical protein
MSGASIEETLELWAASLRDVKTRMRPLFTKERVATSAGLRVAWRLAQRQIEPADVIAWPLWRRAHQAAQQAHLASKAQL